MLAMLQIIKVISHTSFSSSDQIYTDFNTTANLIKNSN